MIKGYLALVLHAHLPFVRHPEDEHCLEERWLFEGITETYIPLLQVFQGLVRDGVDFHITFSISPTLLAMLSDKLLQRRYLKHLNSLIRLAKKEQRRTAKMPEFNRLARMYYERLTAEKEFYHKYNSNLITPFKELQEQGVMEIITSAATHAFLPLVLTEQALRAQIATAIDQHVSFFDRKPRGIWLPECGYSPKLERILHEFGLEYFCVDAHALRSARPQPLFGPLSPVLTPAGVAAFGRDEECSRQVWSAQEGYPGDFDYREYYRDIGFDLPLEEVTSCIHPDGIRVNTGIKYYRITGKGDHKEPYEPNWARDKAALHADNFMFNRQQQVEYWQQRIGRVPVVTAPYDAELFGHWWFEGPLWLDILLRKLHFDQDSLKTITPSAYLHLYSDLQVCDLAMSSWGRNGYADVWLRGENDWIYPALHLAEQRMTELADNFPKPSTVERRALKQAGRELMLAQSSDWAFTMDSKTTVEYAVKRTKYHVNRFTRLYTMLKSGSLDEAWLAALESVDNLFPDLEYRYYCSPKRLRAARPVNGKPRLLMLAWEYPPHTVGGLGRHVFALSCQLAEQGWEVHVLTLEPSLREAVEELTPMGVHVHRIPVLKPDGGEFIHWVFQFNLMLIDYCRKLAKEGLRFDIVHAHDWLVCTAARIIKHSYNIPLVATIHATEHGRNGGIHTDLQRQIHALEGTLTYEAWRVIVCSGYMRDEVIRLFNLPTDKVDVIRNGVDLDFPEKCAGQACLNQEPYAHNDEKVILFVGRLVREKGVYTLLDAIPRILAAHPEAKVVIAGTGPEENRLKKLIQPSIAQKVLFTGFVKDEERNRLLQIAYTAVFPSLYEPFGIVALEAMAAGTPVVVSDVGGLAEIVQHGINGLKAYPGDAYSLALQVIELLANPALARQVSATALTEVGNYNWSRIAQITIGVYERVLGEKESVQGIGQIASTLDCVDRE